MKTGEFDLKTVDTADLPAEARPPARTPDAVYYPSLGEDIVANCKNIAMFWLGRDDKKAQRATYFALAKSNIPSFHFKSRLCIRKSTVFGFIWAQESKSMDDLEARLVRTHVALTAALPLLDELLTRDSDEHKLKVALREARRNIGELLVR